MIRTLPFLFSLMAATLAGAEFKVIGYFPSWHGEVRDIPFSKLTHVNFSFAQVGFGGTVEAPAMGKLRELVQRAHAQGVKVGIAVGGWNDGDATPFEAMSAKPATRANFVKSAVAFCQAQNVDGIDIDWEYPVAASAANYAALMKELGEALHKQGKYLSTAVIAKGDQYGAHVQSPVFAAIDMLNIMAYDFQHEYPSHSPFELATASLDYWLKRGCPPEKAMLGVPFYGRSPETPYRDLVRQDAQAANKDQVGACFYNGAPTMVKKAVLAHEKAGGIMIWEISQDAAGKGSLLEAIHQQVLAWKNPASQGPGTAAPDTAIDYDAEDDPLAPAVPPPPPPPDALQVLAPDLIRLMAPAMGDYTLRILSGAGAVVYEKTLMAKDAGKLDFRWIGRRLPAGKYSAVVEGDDVNLTKAFQLPLR